MFRKDKKDEIAAVRRIAESIGARVAVSRHWALGGEGALELADAVLDACNDEKPFKYHYEQSAPLRKRIEQIATTVYGAKIVEYSPQAEVEAKRIESDPSLANFATCMVKTHLSVTDDPSIKGSPVNWPLRIRNIMVYGGARLIVPVAGDISLMPGTSSDPAFRRVDVDTENGNVQGLF